MKFIITESQKDRAILRYLDLLNLNIFERQNVFYFVMSEEDKYAQIKFNKSDGNCFIVNSLINEMSIFFSLKNDDVRDIISRWVEDTLQMKVVNTYVYTYIYFN